MHEMIIAAELRNQMVLPLVLNGERSSVADGMSLISKRLKRLVSKVRSVLSTDIQTYRMCNKLQINRIMFQWQSR